MAFYFSDEIPSLKPNRTWFGTIGTVLRKTQGRSSGFFGCPPWRRFMGRENTWRFR